MPRQKLGQHFLADASWRERIARTFGAASELPWLEIGAGHGEMTQFLARTGVPVIAIEADAMLANELQERAAAWPGVKIVHGNVLSLDLPSLAGKRFRIYGNLPYYITSPILHRLFRLADAIESIHIVIQLEVAARIAALPGRRAYGYLSALCQYYARPEIAFRIPPGAFHPPPKVHSALVSMHLPGERAQLNVADDARFLQFLHDSFAHKRKTLRNNLRNVFPETRVAAALAFCNLAARARAEELSLAQFVRLFGFLSS